MKTKIKALTESGVFAALIFVATLSGAVAPIGGGAYIHIGDALIYTAVLFLPWPFAIAAAAIGAGLADLMLGSAVYIVPTVIIKSLTVLCAKLLKKLSAKPLAQDMLICLSGAVTVLGYFVAEIFMLAGAGSGLLPALEGAASGMLFNLLQALASAVLFMIISAPARKIYARIKKDV